MSESLQYKVMQWNLRGLHNKRYILKNLIAVTKPFIINLQESFYLNDKELNELNELFKDYIIYYKNRVRQGPANPRGGVAILVHRSVPHRLLHLNTELEALAINIVYQKKNVGICSLYLPPGVNFTVQDLTDLSSQLGDHHLLLGDFNGHNVVWGSETTDNKGLIISDFVSNTDNVLLNSGEPTHVDATTGNLSAIDLSIASPRLSLDCNWSTYTDTLGSDHFPIVIGLGNQNFVDDNFMPLCLYKTSNVNWNDYTVIDINTEGNNANDKCRSIKNSILDAAEATLPKVRARTPRILVPWWTPECRQAITERNRAYKAYYRRPTPELYSNSKRLRAYARLVISDAKKRSWRTFISQINRDTPVTEIWEYIKRIKGRNFSRPFYLTVDNDIIEDPKLIADKIAEHFASVSDDSNYSDIFIEHRRDAELPLNFMENGFHEYNEPFSIGELLFVLGKVRGSSAGPDGIKYEMLQNLSPQNKVKLLEFYNYLWSSQTFPDEWAHSITVPIHKPGKDFKSASSYRPIALTNVLCKVMERLVNRRLTKFLEDNNYLHPMQSGFRPGRNTMHNLLNLEHDVKKSLHFNNFTVAVFLDIEKAFDMTPRWLIMKRLHEMGLRGNLPVFIGNFIRTRKFRVKIGNKLSNTYVQQNGVPQGSVLSPTLFLIVINNILSNPPPGVKISLYADDVVLWVSSFYLQTCLTCIQRALDLMQGWSEACGLRFSTTKTKAIVFMRPYAIGTLRYSEHIHDLTLYGARIDMVTHHRYLGLVFDRSMTWKYHILDLKLSLVSKINILKAISGVSWGADRQTMLMLYRNMIRPKLAYGCALYSSAKTPLLDLLVAEQNKCLKLATGAVKCTHTPILEVEAFVYPLRYFFDKMVLLTAASILRMYRHPLRFILNEFNRFIGSSYKPFCTRAHEAAGVYNVPLSEIESTPPVNMTDWDRKKGCVVQNQHIHKSECPLQLLIEANMIVDRYPDLEHFYTDGSKIGEKCGGGVSSRRHNGGWRIPDNFSVFDAELFAIFTTLEYIYQHKLPSVIFTDSRSALAAIFSGTSKHPLALRICRRIIEEEFTIRLVWVPAHVGLYGNEQADFYAKRSLGYRRISNCPYSPDTFKRITDIALFSHWKRYWIGLDLPRTNKFRNDIVKFDTETRYNRKEEVVLCRLRCDATLLTHMIPHIYRVYPDICEDCNELLTVPHILIDCVKFYGARRRIREYFALQNTRLTAFRLLQDDETVVQLLFDYLNTSDLISHI